MTGDAPLLDRAESLLARLRRKKPTRGDVTAEIQAATVEVLKALAHQMCGHAVEIDAHEFHDCGVEKMWRAWEPARRRLWGKLG